MKEYFKYAYELPPNDFFIGFTDLDEMFKYNNSFEFQEMRDDLNEIVEHAKSLFIRYTHWQGDGDIFLSSLPGIEGDGYPIHFVTIKQEKSGTTFLASPIKLYYWEKFKEYDHAIKSRPSFW